MKSNTQAVNSFQNLVNTEFTLDKGHLVPTCVEEPKKKESVLFRIKTHFRRQEALRKIEDANAEHTREIIEKLANLKLDIDSMSKKTIYVDSKTMNTIIGFCEPTLDLQRNLKDQNTNIRLIKFYLKLTNTKDLSFLNQEQIFDYMEILEYLKDTIYKSEKVDASVMDYLFLLEGHKKYNCENSKLKENILDGIEKLNLRLIFALGNRTIQNMRKLDERTKYFMKLQETCLLDEETVRISIDKLLDKFGELEDIYKTYLLPIADKKCGFNHALFKETLKQLEKTIYELLGDDEGIKEKGVPKM